MFHYGGRDRFVVLPEWFEMYFTTEWGEFQKQIKKIVFNTGYTEKEVFEKFCKSFRSSYPEPISQEECEIFSDLFIAWSRLSSNFKEKFYPLQIFPDFNDNEEDEIMGGFFCLHGVYVVHPSAERISDGFVLKKFKNDFPGKHRWLYVDLQD